MSGRTAHHPRSTSAASRLTTLQGHIDQADRDILRGWAFDPAAPDARVSLLITANDALVGRVLADRPRADLLQAGLGDGRHGFELRLVTPLSPLQRQTIAIRRELDGADIPGSPAILPAATAFDTTLQVQLGRMLTDVHSEADLRSRLEFLASQTDALLQIQAEANNPARLRETLRRHRWRWGPEFDVSAPDAEPAKLRALVIDERLPRPGRDAGSEAILSHAASLQRLGFEVTIAPADMQGGADAQRLEAAGLRCSVLPWTSSVEEKLRREADGFDLIYLHRVAISTLYAGLVRRHQKRARVIFGVADLQHLRLARQAEIEGRPELRDLARHVLAQEIAAIQSADAVVTHSAREAELIESLVPGARVQRILWTQAARPTAIGHAQRHGLAFIGSFGHPPNMDAARWLIDEIMPLVHQTDPRIACLLVGSGLPESLADAPGITVLGHVADLADVFDRVRLTVAPLAYGAGVKGKVLTSLAAGMPCVGTPIAAEGLDLPPILAAQMAPDAAGMAALILRLHDDGALARSCRDAGLAYVAEHCSPAAIDAAVAQAAGIRVASL